MLISELVSKYWRGVYWREPVGIDAMQERRQFYTELINTKWDAGTTNRRDGVVVRASASQSVDLGFIPQIE